MKPSSDLKRRVVQHVADAVGRVGLFVIFLGGVVALIWLYWLVART